MKMRLQLASVLLLAVFLFSQGVASAAAALPSTAVWFTPASAAVGSPITLNALVYNSQSVSATVMVAFTAASTTIGTATETIAAESAKTLSVNWTMPSTNTFVTAAVVTAVASNKQSLPSLVGTIGTVTVGTTAVTPLFTGITFPGSTQINAWFAPLLSQIEAFRIKEAGIFSTERDVARLKVGTTAASTPTVITQPDTPAPAVTSPTPQTDGGTTSIILGTPGEYLTLAYTSTLASLFSSQALFYIVFVLAILLLLRFIVNLIF